MSLLLQAIANPGVVSTLSHQDWNRLLQEIRGQRIEARISYLIEDHGLEPSCPREAWEELRAQRYYPQFIQAQARLELRKVVKALSKADTPILLLKGAAYMVAGLPLARGRTFTDLDILVPRQRLEAAETALLAAGWQQHTNDAYDQRYYRRWMHELPPMYHPERGILIDVHHSILPLTSRIRLDPELLWSDSISLPRSPLRVLSPVDMLLHSATHLFQDGEIRGGFANLLDIHEMIIEFGRDATFFERLPRRAEQLDLGRPLYYALVFCRRLLGTPLPEFLIRQCRSFAPGRLSDWSMGRLVPPVLGPRWPDRSPAGFAAWLLYMRSHWLRMPPSMLAAHLTRKALRRSTQRA